MDDLKLTDLLALGSASAFILTIVYLYGYSTALGANLFLYFSSSDYLRLAIEWLAPVVIAGIVGTFLGKFFTRVERGATEEQIAARSRSPRFIRTFRRLGDMAVPVVLVLAAAFTTLRSFLTEVPPEELYGVWGVAGGALWIALVGWYAKEPKLVKGWTPTWRLCVTLLPALAILALCYGFYAGKTGKRLYLQPADLQVFVKGQTTPLVGRAAFLLDNYLVLQSHERQEIVVIPRAEMTKLLHSKRG